MNKVLQFLIMKIIVIPPSSGINACIKPGAFYRPAESFYHVGACLRIQAVGPAFSARALNINEYRVIQAVILAERCHHRCLFHSFYLIYGLSEEINSHFDAGVGGALYILREFGIFYQSALCGTAVTAAYDGKLDSVSRNLFPVYILLIYGNIYSQNGVAAFPLGCYFGFVRILFAHGLSGIFFGHIHFVFAQDVKPYVFYDRIFKLIAHGYAHGILGRSESVNISKLNVILTGFNTGNVYLAVLI